MHRPVVHLVFERQPADGDVVGRGHIEAHDLGRANLPALLVQAGDPGELRLFVGQHVQRLGGEFAPHAAFPLGHQLEHARLTGRPDDAGFAVFVERNVLAFAGVLVAALGGELEGDRLGGRREPQAEGDPAMLQRGELAQSVDDGRAGVVGRFRIGRRRDRDGCLRQGDRLDHPDMMRLADGEAGLDAIVEVLPGRGTRDLEDRRVLGGHRQPVLPAIADDHQRRRGGQGGAGLGRLKITGQGDGVAPLDGRVAGGHDDFVVNHDGRHVPGRKESPGQRPTGRHECQRQQDDEERERRRPQTPRGRRLGEDPLEIESFGAVLGVAEHLADQLRRAVALVGMPAEFNGGGQAFAHPRVFGLDCPGDRLGIDADRQRPQDVHRLADDQQAPQAQKTGPRPNRQRQVRIRQDQHERDRRQQKQRAGERRRDGDPSHPNGQVVEVAVEFLGQLDGGHADAPGGGDSHFRDGLIVPVPKQPGQARSAAEMKCAVRPEP